MNLLFLTFVFPLIGFLLLSFSRGRWSENTAAAIGVGALGLSAIVAAYVIWQFNVAPPAGGAFTQHLWTWIDVDGFTPTFTLYLDGLAVTMLGVVVGVGFLIHLFASWYMRGDPGYSRFFSYTNLFIASMLFLVLGDDLLFLYLGWEGVGLCSYLLIGFYYSERKNGNAALKAFIVTRIGDVFMAIGLFILFYQLGTLNIQALLARAPGHFQVNDFWIVLATLMLLGGAVGKSAQLPLQTWLADAMAGPTPVSALIHAATMVTAGVYLIARTHGLFELAPGILHLVGIIGAVTLVLAGFAALVQTDIKRILAYSTMSQIGYMFMALGVGAWSGAIFHLMTHAFFKALLFLASGAVIIACHHEQNIFKMGGLWKKLPLAYASFIVGGAALSALPIITAGFYSKDEILWEAFASGHTYLLYAGLLGAFMTSIYTFRLIFIAFHGEAKTEAHAGHGIAHWLPLGTLIVLSTFIGAWIHPPLAGVLPESVGHAGGGAQHSLEIASGAIALAGILLAALLFLGRRSVATAMANSGPGRLLSRWWFAAWGFDWLYDKLFVKPYLLISHLLRKDPVDKTISLIPAMAKGGNAALSRSETGQLRWYAASIAFGAVLVIGAVVAAAV
ncbi:NADH-quinone oxidoreductase subunit L [Pseudomonas typographi]|uniref:NADH-quinone oxidoreductase subunit L n=1 Tax=Pseudomonas typographi TaxID=2715964 RepID=UPI00168A3366|nr:NADH-quinone oxidoreductase subunit L [Pseudomonas typographi]MBD1554051.1 NADH-quinone oxidoreductase subunit L [Pseudomonas typographi]MBD1589377.1 NADH-quinone oxidoreductase subunit L [Pseudomonas typographi]